jgi:hypothetical protein
MQARTVQKTMRLKKTGEITIVDECTIAAAMHELVLSGCGYSAEFRMLTGVGNG